MRKVLLACLLLTGSAQLSFAQAILTADNINPFLGDIYINNVCDTTDIVPGPAGASQSWIFTSLLPAPTGTLVDTAKAVACGTTPNCSKFTGSDIAISIPTANTTNYIITSPTKLSQKGYYNSSTQNAVYTDPIDQFRFPFTYLSTFTDPCAGLVTFTPSGGPTIIATETSTVTTICDGYGTLTLPGSPSPSVYSNVLRVHSSQSFRDSANLFGTPVVETFQLETYTWYTPGYHSPLLTISTASGLYNYKVVSYSAKKLRTSVPQLEHINASLTLYPNPVENVLNIKFDAATNEHVRVTLADMVGREVAVLADKDVHGIESISYNTLATAPGLYILRLQSGTEVITRKVAIK